MSEPRRRRAHVRYNDWRAVDVPPSNAFVPELPASVIVPYFENPPALARTLAALEQQTYPRRLLEFIVVDDGSRPRLAARPPSATTLDVRVIRHEQGRGGAAQARNTGAREARNEILVFLDCDMIATTVLIAAHARWHHVLADAVTVGFYARVGVEELDTDPPGRAGATRRAAPQRGPERPWIERHMARTRDLTSGHDDLFRTLSGGNFGISRTFYHGIGGFDAGFATDRFEDLEFAYRAYTRGAVFVPVRDAHARHQGRWDADAWERRAATRPHGRLVNLVAHPAFRHAAPGRTYAVPRHVVSICADARPDAIAETVEHLLADDDDLVVRVDTGSSGGAANRLREQFGPDPRVRIDPGQPALDEFPASPYFVSLPVAPLPTATLRRLRSRLGPAATATVILADGSRGSITRAWALHRARRTGGVAGDFGADVTVKLPARHRCRGGRRRQTGALVRLPRGRLHRVLTEARHIRGLRTARAFLAWLALGLQWWIQMHLRSREQPEDAPPLPGNVDLGVEVALVGQRARAILPGYEALGRDPRDAEVLVVDDHGGESDAQCPTVVLAAHPELAAPAFDPTRWNPVGWVRRVEDRVAALGPLDALPSGSKARHTVRATTPETVRCFHHVEDLAGFHEGPETRAGTLIRIAAAGTPVHVADPAPELEAILGRDLYRLMRTPVRDLDLSTRESQSIRMRRLALRNHTARARARQICERAMTDPPALPSVSVVLATRRPTQLEFALANVAKQHYPRLELVLALHGNGFDSANVEQLVDRFRRPCSIIKVDERYPLGTVLNRATAAASGRLITKMDDDDLYDEDHVWDLVLAHEYARAEVVGKGADTFYFRERGVTVRRRQAEPELYGGHIAGAAMLIGRTDLDAVGGWPRLAEREDVELVNRVVRAGGRVYRTHGRGLLVMRGAAGHAWRVTDTELLRGASIVLRGLRADLADIATGNPSA